MYRIFRPPSVAGLAALLLCACQDSREPERHPLNVQDTRATSFREGATIITHGPIVLGINPEGHLNVASETVSAGLFGTTTVGLRYLATPDIQWEALGPGCHCEGWGVADAVTNVEGHASGSAGLGGISNVTVQEFVANPAAGTARSVVQVGGSIEVIHRFRPSSSMHLFEIEVEIRNISGADLEDVRYTRGLDWDVPPNTFSEHVTIAGTEDNPNVLNASDNGFASVDPLAANSPLQVAGDVVDDGPADHGAHFDFAVGRVPADGSRTFRLFYGAAPNEALAEQALDQVGASVYSLGQSDWDGVGDPTVDFGSGNHGHTEGEPVTFMFGYSNDPCPEIEAAANAISTRASEGETRFTRDEYITLFDAVECQTKVPAAMLRSYAFGEGLGQSYDDPYPRHVIEPCDQAYNVGTLGMAYPQLFSRYYGVSGWPLLGIDVPDSFDCHANANANANAAGSCGPNPADIEQSDDEIAEAFAKNENLFHLYTCEDPPEPSKPGARGWAALWDDVSHVALGDDRPCHNPCGTDDTFSCRPECQVTPLPTGCSCSDSFGLGIAQITFSIADLLAEESLSYIGDIQYSPTVNPPGIYPFGGTPDASAQDSIPDQSGQMLRIIDDPQYNIMLAAQLALYKSQFGSDQSASVGHETLVDTYFDEDYQLDLLTAGPGVPAGGSCQLRNHWICNVGQVKAGGAGCGGPGAEGNAQDFIRDTIALDIDTESRKCFCADRNERIGGDCKRPLAYAFAVGIRSDRFAEICDATTQPEIDALNLPKIGCVD